jgi:hypothetical protein
VEHWRDVANNEVSTTPWRTTSRRRARPAEPRASTVSFHNWPSLDRPFLEELGSLLGPRWRIVYQHT